jgi:hypothetical protein
MIIEIVNEGVTEPSEIDGGYCCPLIIDIFVWLDKRG